MSGKFYIFIKYIWLALILVSPPTNAQLLNDSTSFSLVKKNIDCIYNLEFNLAGEINSEISRINPGHPFVPLLKGMLTYWRNYPLIEKTLAQNSFEEDMRRCISISERNNDPALDAEYLLANLCARGFLIMFYADNDLTFKVIPLAASTYTYLRRAFDYASTCLDLYYFTGLYNYYREAYPRAHPVYKTAARLFPYGDIERGLKELDIVAAGSVMLRAESYFTLAWIYQNYENDYAEALGYSKSLNALYPENLMYRAIYIKNLLLVKQYDKAEKQITESTGASWNRYFQAQLSVFKGIIQEKKYHNNNMAERYYRSGIAEIAYFGGYGNEFAAYCYYGLSRISEARGEFSDQKKYKDEANKLSEFRKIRFDD